MAQREISVISTISYHTSVSQSLQKALRTARSHWSLLKKVLHVLLAYSTNHAFRGFSTRCHRYLKFLCWLLFLLSPGCRVSTHCCCLLRRKRTFSAKKVKEVSILEPLCEIVSLFPDVQIMWWRQERNTSFFSGRCAKRDETRWDVVSW